MNPAAVHLALNTFPPILDVAALLVLLIGMIWKSQAVVRAALALLVLAALISIPVYLTGEDAEHLVEELEGVNAVAIHPHEEAAEWAFILLLVQGAVALAVLFWFRRRELPRWAVAVTLLITLVAGAAVFRVAYLGGRIHHPETRIGP